jgi:hypothetical protein
VLPTAFVDALQGNEEVIVTSREDGRERSVRAWYVMAPPGTIYLFTYSYALRVVRWRKDPWVRLRVPGSDHSAEGTVHFLTEKELDAAPLDQVLERWWMWGATTEPGLRRMIRDGSHVLIRVDVP